MTFLVQQFLEKNSLAQLKAVHGVNYRICGHKVSLNYDMLEAKNNDPIACECRGTILAPVVQNANGIDETAVLGETIILAKTMNRFFNHGQEEAAVVDFENPETVFFEKLDGTMTALYFDTFTSQWCVATRSVPEADLPIDGFGEFTFRKLFEKAIEETTYRSFEVWLKEENLSRNMTYVFELCTPANRIVVDYETYGISLIAICRNEGGEEKINDSRYALEFVPKCRTYKLGSMQDMLEFVSSQNPLEHEGIVALQVTNNGFNRVKVKNPSYLALHRAKDVAIRSPRALVELCLLGKLDDALPLLPEHMSRKALGFQEALRELINYSNGYFEGLLTAARELCLENQWDLDKDFRKALALSVQKLPKADMSYVMMRFGGVVESYSDYINLQKEKTSGEFKKGFLDKLVEVLETN